MNYLIFIDASADIDTDAVDISALNFIPMEYSIGEENRKCYGPESREKMKSFYAAQRNGIETKTTLIPPYTYEETLAPFLGKGQSALYLCLSSGLSSTFSSAMTAKQSLKESYPDVDFMPLDTKSATAGMGLLIERALRNRDKGMTLQENYDDLSEAVKHICHWFMVPDLMYLKRGGRVSAATAVAGTMLNIKPILTITSEGTLETIDKKRGVKAAATRLLSLFEENYVPGEDPVYVLDADNEEVAAELRAKLIESHPELTIRSASLCPIIGAHTGPDLAAIVHMS